MAKKLYVSGGSSSVGEGDKVVEVVFFKSDQVSSAPKVKGGAGTGKAIVIGKKTDVKGQYGVVSTGKFRVAGVSEPGTSIGAKYAGFMEQVGLVQKGLPTQSIKIFQGSTGLSIGRITEVAGISAGTHSRRSQGGRLSPQESERLLRVSRIFELATSLYRGDQQAAMSWLETPLAVLGDERPLDVARTEPGAREVEDLIGRIQHGIVS